MKGHRSIETDYSLDFRCVWHKFTEILVIEGSDISNIQVTITSTSTNFSTTGVDWYVDGNTLRYLKTYDNTNVIIPIEYTGSGSLELELFIVTKVPMMIKYPKIVVIWN